jgi:two-component system phosphate regulon response regulator PhoB
VVEDDPFMTALLRTLLERQQMRVHTVPDGRAALDLLQAPPVFDAVVLDWMLPQASGLEVLTQIRQHPQWAQVPVLVLSAVDAGEQIAQAFAAGANDYVTKPFNPQALNARLQRWLPRTGQGS